MNKYFNCYVKIYFILLTILPIFNCFWIPCCPPVRCVSKFTKSRNARTFSTTAHQMSRASSNRIRDCAVRNKEHLLNVINSPDRWTRRGKQRMDELVEQLSVSSPLQSPSTSKMNCGLWVRQGVISREIQECNRTEMREKKTFLGFIRVESKHTLVPIDDHSLLKTTVDVRISLFRFIHYTVATPSQALTVSFIYLDSDMQIVVNGESGTPQVFSKLDGLAHLGLLSLAKSTLAAIMKMLYLLGSSPSRLITGLRSKSVEALGGTTAETLAKSRSVGFGGMIGDVDWETETSSRLSHENLLHKYSQQSTRDQPVVIGDLTHPKRSWLK